MTQQETSEPQPPAETKPKSSSNSKNVLMTVGANLLIGLLSLGTGSLTARLLGRDARGELAAIQTIPMFVASIAQLGLPEAVVFFTAKKPANGGRYYATAILTIAVSICFFGLAGFFLLPYLLQKQSPLVVSTTQYYLLCLLPLWTLLGISQNTLRGAGQLPTWNISRVLPLLGWLIILVICALQGTKSPTVVAQAFLIQLTISSLIAIGFIFKKIPRPFRFDKQEFPGMLRYGLPAMATTAPQLLNLRLDQMLMAGLLAPANLGLYTVAVAWSGMVSPILQGLGSVLFPRVAALPTFEEKVEAFTQGGRLGALVGVGLALSLMLVTPVLLPLVFSAQFKAAIVPTLILIVAAVIAGENLILAEGIRGLGHTSVVMRSELCGLVSTVIVLSASLHFLPDNYKIWGAAVASLLGYSTTTAAHLFQARKLVSLPVSAMILPSSKEVKMLASKIKSLRRRTA